MGWAGFGLDWPGLNQAQSQSRDWARLIQLGPTLCHWKQPRMLSQQPLGYQSLFFCRWIPFLHVSDWFPMIQFALINVIRILANWGVWGFRKAYWWTVGHNFGKDEFTVRSRAHLYCSCQWVTNKLGGNGLLNLGIIWLAINPYHLMTGVVFGARGRGCTPSACSTLWLSPIFGVWSEGNFQSEPLYHPTY